MCHISWIPWFAHPPPSSFTDTHRFIGSHHPNWHNVSTSARLTYLSVYDIRDGASESEPSPSPPSSLSHAHRFDGSHNPNWHTMPTSARMTYLSVDDSRDGASESAPSPSPPSSLTHTHIIQSHNLPTPTLLTFMCTQILWCLTCLVRSRSSVVTMRPDTRLTIFSTHATQCM